MAKHFAEEMKASRILKIAVLAEVALIPVGTAMSWWADGFLPENVLALEENQISFLSSIDSITPLVVALLLVAVIWLGAWVAAFIGLLMLRQWGAWIYLLFTLVSLPIYFVFGFDVRHPIDQVFESVYSVLTGIIIGLAFFSDAIPRNDREPDSIDNGGKSR